MAKRAVKPLKKRCQATIMEETAPLKKRCQATIMEETAPLKKRCQATVVVEGITDRSDFKYFQDFLGTFFVAPFVVPFLLADLFDIHIVIIEIVV
jgi:hypothetical protein